MPAPPDAIQEFKHHKGKVWERPAQGGDPPGHKRFYGEFGTRSKHVPDSYEDFLNGNPVNWRDGDLGFLTSQNDFDLKDAYYDLKIKRGKFEYTYTSKAPGNPFVTVELTHIGGIALGVPPIPTVVDGLVTFVDIATDLDIYIIITLDKIEVRKRIKSAAAPRSFTWKITESDPLPIVRQKVSKGHDNDDRSEPTREGLGPGRTKRQIELTHVETPRPGGPPTQNRCTLEETWTGKTWAVDANRVKSLSTEVFYPVDIDVLVSEEIAADGEDGFAYNGAWSNSYGSSNDNIVWADYYDYRPGWRFTSVAIPNGATIDDATFTVEVADYFGVSLSDGVLDIAAEDDAGAWSSSNRPDQKTPIGAGTVVDWQSVSTFTDISVDVATDMQTLVNRAGWASGNNVALFDQTDRSDGAGDGNDAFAYLQDEANADAGAARLVVNYTVAGGGGLGIPVAMYHYQHNL